MYIYMYFLTNLYLKQYKNSGYNINKNIADSFVNKAKTKNRTKSARDSGGGNACGGARASSCDRGGNSTK